MIAGMGGPLDGTDPDGRPIRCVILSQELILQPQSDVCHFRQIYPGTGAGRSVEEELVVEEGKFYPMMRVVRSMSGR